MNVLILRLLKRALILKELVNSKSLFALVEIEALLCQVHPRLVYLPLELQVRIVAVLYKN